MSFKVIEKYAGRGRPNHHQPDRVTGAVRRRVPRKRGSQLVIAISEEMWDRTGSPPCYHVYRGIDEDDGFVSLVPTGDKNAGRRVARVRRQRLVRLAPALIGLSESPLPTTTLPYRVELDDCLIIDVRPLLNGH